MLAQILMKIVTAMDNVELEGPLQQSHQLFITIVIIFICIMLAQMLMNVVTPLHNAEF